MVPVFAVQGFYIQWVSLLKIHGQWSRKMQMVIDFN